MMNEELSQEALQNSIDAIDKEIERLNANNEVIRPKISELTIENEALMRENSRLEAEIARYDELYKKSDAGKKDAAIRQRKEILANARIIKGV